MVDEVIKLDEETPDRRLAILTLLKSHKIGEYQACMDLHKHFNVFSNKWLFVSGFIFIVTFLAFSFFTDLQRGFDLIATILFGISLLISEVRENRLQSIVLDQAEKNLQESKKINQLICDELKSRESEVIDE
ncbi:hypothetical protein [Piscirickettsia litoralis]|uniref:SMODS and SLOG-associating 2TM effector domain-containing protein n=1 Tax=Piscirickettsia litoralis TaxID=1891921 RepID=A0ABX2ZYC9_9GAMM|nr:hypothetical protein [Piscirickettsia litoralis]ODN41017.1 hypothetical protein BGC07_18470 [Piscirickettsia litoralis]